MEAVLDFFFSGSPLPQGITATSLALITKSPDPLAWSDYRPTSLCNNIHKILTKLLNDRLIEFLPLLIYQKIRVVS